MANTIQKIERAVKVRSHKLLTAKFAIKRTLFRPADRILINAMPKSGSTFLTSALAEVTGAMKFFLGNEYASEQDFYYPRMVDTWNMRLVSHQHAHPNRTNIECLIKFEIKPIIQVRNIFDIVVSAKDHLNTLRRDNVFPKTPDYRSLPEEQKIDAVIDHHVAWQLQFYDGWMRADIEKCVISYEDMIADYSGTIARALEFYNIEAPEDKIIEVADRLNATKNTNAEGTRFNKGEAGRGAEMLSDAQKDRIRRMASYFTSVDMSPLGL